MSIPIKIKRKADGSIDNITFCPTVTIEKQVWESTLHRSMVLEAENTKLKELLKECESSIQYYQETYGAMDLDTYTLLAKLKEVLK